jgi:DNA gyrase subunit B
MMWETTMNPKTRRLIQVLPDEEEKTERLFDVLLGDNLQGRKDFIEEHGQQYMDELDVS